MGNIRNILYIHDLNGEKISDNFKNISEILSDCTIFTDSFDLYDIADTRNKIEKLITQHDIGTIIGNGLGGFYALLGKTYPFRIVINPFMCPGKHLIDVDKNVPQNVQDTFFELEKQTYGLSFYNQGNLHWGYSNTTFGIFGTCPDYSYYDFFAQCYTPYSSDGRNIALIEEGHQELSKNQLAPALNKAFEFVQMMSLEGIGRKKIVRCR